MSNLIQIQNGFKSYGDRNLFQEATFAVNEGEHVGVIGPNGAGKTTLFKILIGQEELDQGELISSRQLRLGYLSQEDDWNLDSSLETLIEQQTQFPMWKVAELGHGLGFSEEHFKQSLTKLSGGYRMRFQLLLALCKEPNLLLLDEPTNYLDLESLLVLEKFLQNYSGAFLLISHDREFLRKVCQYTLEVERGQLTKFSGDIDDYFEQKELLKIQLEKMKASQDSKRKEILDFVNRFGAKATKAKQAQSRLKRLDKMQKIELSPLPVHSKIKIPSPLTTGKEVIEFCDADLGYGETTVLSDVNFRIRRGDHIGIVGVNGAGKTTLLKAIAQEIPLLKGEVKLGLRVDIAYFAQHTVEVLDLESSIFDELQAWAHSDVTPQEILNMAGSLLFSRDDCEKKIKYLSGGEKTRVAIGGLLLSRKSVIVMDEPTNHLDFETVENLSQALREYAGTLIVVSHDRAFIKRVANQLLEIHSGRVSLYPGTYDEYLWSVQKGVLGKSHKEVEKEKTVEEVSVSASSSQSLKKEARKRKRELDKLIKNLEIKLRKTEKQMSEVLEKMSQADTDQVSLAQEYEVLKQTKEEDEEKWLDFSEELNELN